MRPEGSIDVAEEAALSAASETLHRPQTSFLERNRGKLGFAFGVAVGFYAGHIKLGNQQEGIRPQVRAQVVGVLLCGSEGCMALRPEGMEEFGDGCEEPPEGFSEPPVLVIPPECLGGIPQNFPGNAPELEIPASGVEL